MGDVDAEGEQLPKSGPENMSEKEIKSTTPSDANVTVKELKVEASADKIMEGHAVESPELEYTNSYIFSVNGAPSRRIRRAVVTESKEGSINSESVVQRPQSSYRNPLTGTGVNSTDEISYRPKGRISARQAKSPENSPVASNSELKRPSSSFRNPLTGTGLNSIDEINPRPSNMKDGNPLLGVGYDSKRVITDPVPSDKIHPAGYVRKGVAQTPNNHRVPPGGYSTKLW
ncbi:unnamed protein product [Brassicogethes aeneus]|uniref:Microtubule-associated protein Jupiter n=1 Tax=Brassicogethes aeneus TaxID=1431903 RepID=A0A9P0AZ34_BRAAE|nr:unnamed protein product [Brassicogethes aeneus]